MAQVQISAHEGPPESKGFARHGAVPYDLEAWGLEPGLGSMFSGMGPVHLKLLMC